MTENTPRHGAALRGRRSALRILFAGLAAATVAFLAGGQAVADPTLVHATGQRGSVSYDVWLPQTNGSSPAEHRFDQSMLQALEDRLHEGSVDITVNGSKQSYASERHGSITGALFTDWYAKGAAHPNSEVATITIRRDNAQPVTLQALFPDLGAGLVQLSKEAAILVPQTRIGADYFPSGIEPTTSNYANWVPTDAGMQFFFIDQVGPHAAGTITITVPWDHLTNVADPGMLAALRT